MKGIVFAGGYGTRLYPITQGVNKHLLAVYDKPMIYYCLANLMVIGLREIILIVHPLDLPIYQRLLKDGQQWGIAIEYRVQEKPEPLLKNLQLVKEDIFDQAFYLALADNLFYGDMQSLFKIKASAVDKAVIFSKHVDDPERFGVIQFDSVSAQQPVNIISHSPAIVSDAAVTGLFYYPAGLLEEVAHWDQECLSMRGLLMHYLGQQRLQVVALPDEVNWYDLGTAHSLLSAANWVQAFQEQQQTLVGSPDAVAFAMGLIDEKQLAQLAQSYGATNYSQFLFAMLEVGR